MFPHIFYSFSIAAGVTLHVDVLRGENDHHKCVVLYHRPYKADLPSGLSLHSRHWLSPYARRSSVPEGTTCPVQKAFCKIVYSITNVRGPIVGYILSSDTCNVRTASVGGIYHQQNEDMEVQATMSDGSISLTTTLAEGLQENLQVVLVDLQYARVKRAVSCTSVAPLLRVQERETELTVNTSTPGPTSEKPQDSIRTSFGHRRNPPHRSHLRRCTSQPSR